MIIIGCDFHTRYQQIVIAKEETGENLRFSRRGCGPAVVRENTSPCQTEFRQDQRNYQHTPERRHTDGLSRALYGRYRQDNSAGYEDACERVTAHHPLPVQLNVAVAHASKRSPRSQQPRPGKCEDKKPERDGAVDGGDVHAHRCSDRNSPEIEASHDAVHSQMPLPEARRELERTDQQRRQSGQPVRNEQPSDGKVIRPVWM